MVDKLSVILFTIIKPGINIPAVRYILFSSGSVVGCGGA